MVMRKYTDEQLGYLRLRARQGSTNAEHGIPKDEEGLSQEELGDIISELQRTSDQAYQHSLIGVIYYAAFPERERYRIVLEPFLRDPHHAPEILRIFCQEWRVARHYKQELREFIRGVPWDWYPNDPIGWCQQRAVDGVSENWRSLVDPTLLREIIALYERNTGGSNGARARDAAYNSLWRLLDNPPITEAETISFAKELALRLEAATEADREKVSNTFVSAVRQKRAVGR